MAEKLLDVYSNHFQKVSYLGVCTNLCDTNIGNEQWKVDGPLEYLLHSQITDLFVHNTGNREHCSKHSRTNKRRRTGSRYLENCSWNTAKPAKRTFGFLSKVWINQGRGASPPNFTSHSVCEGQQDSPVCHWRHLTVSVRANKTAQSVIEVTLTAKHPRFLEISTVSKEKWTKHQ